MRVVLEQACEFLKAHFQTEIFKGYTDLRCCQKYINQFITLL